MYTYKKNISFPVIRLPGKPQNKYYKVCTVLQTSSDVFEFRNNYKYNLGVTQINIYFFLVLQISPHNFHIKLVS